jgi:ATP-grasp domain-containing protein
MKDILVVCPQERDLRAIRSAGLAQRYRIHCAGVDLDAVDDFDPKAFIEECDSIPADGVVGTKDRSALLAALIAARRGLPGPTPQAMLACQFKPTARALERATVPAATPRFALLDGRPPFGPPFFVKPVVGRLSQRASRIDDPAQIELLEDVDGYMTRYARIAELAGLHPDAVRGFLAEELLSGREVTYEGFVHEGRVVMVGITDSQKYEGTNSFERFEFPSALPPERQDELEDVSARLMPALGFDGGFFNVEFFVPEEGPARIVEVNGRIASQFWPLVQAVHGRSTYEAMFELACGEDPSWVTGPAEGVALSYCLRVFEDAYVEAVPEADDNEFELLVRPGLRLSQQGVNDTCSYRLCIFTSFAATREEAVRLARERAASLPFVLSPVTAAV